MLGFIQEFFLCGCVCGGGGGGGGGNPETTVTKTQILNTFYTFLRGQNIKLNIKMCYLLASE